MMMNKESLDDCASPFFLSLLFFSFLLTSPLSKKSTDNMLGFTKGEPGAVFEAAFIWD